MRRAFSFDHLGHAEETVFGGRSVGEHFLALAPAGQRIGLMIFSSDKEHTLHPAPGTRLTVALSATELMLPIVGGEGALRKATRE